MASRGRGTSLTRPAWMHTPRQPPTPTLPPNPNPDPDPDPNTVAMPSLSSSSPTAAAALAASASASPSVSDWARATAADGRPYWYSRASGQTTWHDPTTTSSSAVVPVPVPAPSVPEPKPKPPDTTSDSAAPIWRQVRTPDGKTYFHNRLTNQTTWTAPALVSAVPATPSTATTDPVKTPASSGTPIASSSLPEGWTKHRTDDGRVYFYHSATRHTRWTPPEANNNNNPIITTNTKSPAVSRKRPASPTTTPSTPSSPTTLPAPWRKHTTPSGRHYFFNPLTNHTTWTHPSIQTSSPDPKRLRPALPSPTSRPDPPAPNAAHAVTRRPRGPDGKPLTDRLAEAYFLKRHRLRQTVSQPPEPPPLDPNASSHDRLTSFHSMLSDFKVSPSTPWLTVMSRCVSDPRYLLLRTYGLRRDAMLKYHTRLLKAQRVAAVLQTRQARQSLVDLLDQVFEHQPTHISSLSAVPPEDLQKLQPDPRYNAVEPRQRDALLNAYFATRARRFAAQRAQRRRDVMQRMADALEASIDPALTHPQLKPSTQPSKPDLKPKAKEEEQMLDVEIEAKPSETTPPSAEDPPVPAVPPRTLFTQSTSYRELERFLKTIKGHDLVTTDDITDVIRRFRRRVDALWETRRAREREARKAMQRDNRASFRSGVLEMLIKGRLSFTARWKEVADVVSQQEFAKPEEHLGAHPADLFEDGVRMFDDRVQQRRDAFKKLLKEAKVVVDEGTTVDTLVSADVKIAAFLADVEPPIAKALLLDRQRREQKRRAKERDKLLLQFRDLVHDSELALDASYDTAVESWKDLPLYKELVALGGEDAMRRAVEEYVHSLRLREERRLKRKLDQGLDAKVGMGMDMDMDASDRGAKRARLSDVGLGTVAFGRPAAEAREEENGWAAVVSEKEAMTEEEKLAEKERRKREILESLKSEKTLANPQV